MIPSIYAFLQKAVNITVFVLIVICVSASSNKAIGLVSLKLMKKSKKSKPLISYGFAVAVIATLLSASVLGWVVSELIPPDFMQRKAFYLEKWGMWKTRFVEILRLYDPFHSYWYQIVIALFFVVLLLCVVTNWKRFLMPFITGVPIASKPRDNSRWNAVAWSWRALKEGEGAKRDPVSWFGEKYGRKELVEAGELLHIYRSIEEVLRKNRFKVRSIRSNGSIYFRAQKGSARFLGSFMLHIAILAIAIGGLIGSFWGWSEVLYGKAGDRIPLDDSGYSVRIDAFHIEMAEEGGIGDYVSDVTLLGGAGDSIASANIRVNHPLVFSRFRVLQHSYHTEEDEFEWAKVKYRFNGHFLYDTVAIHPNEEVPIGEDSSVTIRIAKFYPDFKMRGDYYYSATGFPYNPAVQIELSHNGKMERGLLFLRYPRFNSTFKIPADIALVDVEPTFYSGLQVTTNPGSSLIITGIILGTIGLILLMFFDYRSVVGGLNAEGVFMKGAGYRVAERFEREFVRLTEAVAERFKAVLKDVKLHGEDD